tara:strand:- start:296 stop:691 length:396 start_codon:yes stop_codon:yes gene_type:complete
MAETINSKLADKYFPDYADCALSLSTGENDEPLDGLYSVDDISDDTAKAMKKDIVDFLDYLDEQLEGWSDSLPDWYGFEQFAHDFWLTRNGHGAGFWDRGLGKIGDQLTEHSKAFGSCDLYVSDDSEICIM